MCDFRSNYGFIGATVCAVYDNFISGNRDDASTENFVKAGYDVIFLYRRGTCQQYCRSLPDDPFLECFEFTDKTSIRVHASHLEAVKGAVMDQQTICSSRRSLTKALILNYL